MSHFQYLESKTTIFFGVFIYLFFISNSLVYNEDNQKENANNFIGKSKEIITEKVLKQFQNEKYESFGNLICKIGLKFVGTPYLGGTLEGEPEICSINVEGLDCVTFFETSLNIARMIAKNDFTVDNLPKYIIQTRYRNNEIHDYSSRLHYTSDWIFQNVQNSIVEDISQKFGGKKTRFELSFMSQNPKFYKALQNHPELIEKIRNQEKEINKRDYYIIPTDKVKQVEKELRSGDIIAIAMNRKDLDYSHTGMIFVNRKKEARFLHASSAKKMVVVDTTISEYLKSNIKNTGITVLRPISPNKDK